MIIHDFMLRCCGVCRVFVGSEFSTQLGFKSLVRIRSIPQRYLRYSQFHQVFIHKNERLNGKDNVATSSPGVWISPYVVDTVEASNFYVVASSNIGMKKGAQKKKRFLGRWKWWVGNGLQH